MRVAVVAGPDPGHSFPAIALCLKFLAAGDEPTLLTGVEWLATARAAGIDAIELEGLDPTPLDDDRDAGAKITSGPPGWRCSTRRASRRSGAGPDRVRRNHRVRALSAELVEVPWVELSRIRCTFRQKACRP